MDLDPDYDLVPADKRTPTCERVVSVRKELPRCWAYTRQNQQCPRSGTMTNLPNGHGQAALCEIHRRKFGDAGGAL